MTEEAEAQMTATLDALETSSEQFESGELTKEGFFVRAAAQFRSFVKDERCKHCWKEIISHPRWRAFVKKHKDMLLSSAFARHPRDDEVEAKIRAEMERLNAAKA